MPSLRPRIWPNSTAGPLPPAIRLRSSGHDHRSASTGRLFRKSIRIARPPLAGMEWPLDGPAKSVRQPLAPTLPGIPGVTFAGLHPEAVQTFRRCLAIPEHSWDSSAKTAGTKIPRLLNHHVQPASRIVNPSRPGMPADCPKTPKPRY